MATKKKTEEAEDTLEQDIEDIEKKIEKLKKSGDKKMLGMAEHALAHMQHGYPYKHLLDSIK